MVLGFCLALLVLAALLALLDAGGEQLQIGSKRLPSICALRNSTGLPCPGCGLTRSWVALAAGDPARSLHQHRLGWLVMAYVLLQVVRHGAWLLLASARRLIDRLGAWLDRGLVGLALLLLLNWGLTLWMLLLD